MYGTTKIVVNKKEYFKSVNNNYVAIYDKSSNVVLTYRMIHIGLCSIDKLYQGIYIQDDKIKPFASSFFPRFTKTITVQNRTKEGYQTALDCGFKEMGRLPGNYTNKAVANTTKDNCMAIMYRGSSDKAIDKSREATVEVLRNMLNSSGKPADKKGVESYLCINPTGTLTRNKVYKSVNKLITKAGFISIYNDNNRKIIVKASNFIKIVE